MGSLIPKLELLVTGSYYIYPCACTAHTTRGAGGRNHGCLAESSSQLHAYQTRLLPDTYFSGQARKAPTQSFFVSSPGKLRLTSDATTHLWVPLLRLQQRALNIQQEKEPPPAPALLGKLVNPTQTQSVPGLVKILSLKKAGHCASNRPPRIKHILFSLFFFLLFCDFQGRTHQYSRMG